MIKKNQKKNNLKPKSMLKCSYNTITSTRQLQPECSSAYSICSFSSHCLMCTCMNTSLLLLLLKYLGFCHFSRPLTGFVCLTLLTWLVLTFTYFISDHKTETEFLILPASLSPSPWVIALLVYNRHSFEYLIQSLCPTEVWFASGVRSLCMSIFKVILKF